MFALRNSFLAIGLITYGVEIIIDQTIQKLAEPPVICYNDRLKIWCLFTNKENGRLRNNINKENFKKKFSGMKRHLFDIIQILFNGVPFLVKDIGPHEREPQVELLLSMQSSGSEGRWDQK